MPHNGHCRPKDNAKKPKKDNQQPERMRHIFDQPAPGSQKNRGSPQTNDQRKFE